MANPLFPQGTTATIKDEPSGTATALTDLIDIGPNTRVKPVGRIDGLSDTTVIKKPISKKDLGTVTFTFNHTDDAVASCQRTTLESKMDSGQLVTIKPNYPGAFDASTALVSWYGYITQIEDSGSQRDQTDPMRYTITLEVTG